MAANLVSLLLTVAALLWPQPLALQFALEALAILLAIVLAALICRGFIRSHGRNELERVKNAAEVRLSPGQMVGIALFVLAVGAALGLAVKAFVNR